MKKTKKLLGKLKRILSAEHQAQLAKYKSLKKVLKALRVEKVRLEAELEATHDEQKREEISDRLKVISAQRKKGLGLVKALKEEQKASKGQN